MGNICKKLHKKNHRGFDVLPDEIVLKIFTYLSFKDLAKCAKVSKRFRSICYSESLWCKINACMKIIPVRFLSHILSNGCQYLNLQWALIDGPQGNLPYLNYLTGPNFNSENAIDSTFNVTKPSKLKYLNLKRCSESDQEEFTIGGSLRRTKVIEELLTSCHSLQKLSVSELTLNSTILKCVIQNGKTLKVLDLSTSYNACSGFEYSNKRLDLNSLKDIVRNCVSLTELNMDYIKLCEEGFEFLCNNLTRTIRKLSLMRDGPHEINNKNIKELLQRCANLKELNLTNIRNGFGHGLIQDEKEHFKIQYPHLTVYDENFPRIATPSIDRDDAVCGFWEIRSKQIELFCGIGARDSPWSWWL